MSAQPARIRASERPEISAHWGSVWIAADRRPPFKIEGNEPAPRRRWWGGRL